MWRQGVVPLTLVWTHGTRWLLGEGRKTRRCQPGGRRGGGQHHDCLCLQGQLGPGRLVTFPKNKVRSAKWIKMSFLGVPWRSSG